MIDSSTPEAYMVNGVLRVEDLVVEDETHLVLRARNAADELLEVEQLRGGATPDALVRLYRTVRHPVMPLALGLSDLDGLGPVVVYAAAPSISGLALVDGQLPSLLAALRVGERLASALAAAHAVGVCHRDLHLGQVRLEASGLVRLHGWGAAAMGVRSRRITFDGAAYLAPEALQRRDVWASDIYALGVILLELVVGQRATPASVAMVRTPALAAAIRRRDLGLDDAGVDALVALIRAMVQDDWESRPLAMEVARRCARVGATLRGTDLVRYAGDHVPAVLAARASASGWAGRRLVPRVVAPAPQQRLGWAVARAGV